MIIIIQEMAPCNLAGILNDGMMVFTRARLPICAEDGQNQKANLVRNHTKPTWTRRPGD